MTTTNNKRKLASLGKSVSFLETAKRRLVQPTQLDYQDVTFHEEQALVFRVGEYRVTKSIGSGASGDVFLGVHVVTGERVAIKTLQKNPENPKQKRKELRMRKEYAAMAALSEHKHACKLKEVHENDKRVCMVMQYAQGGDLFELVKKRGSLAESEAWRLFKQLVSVVSHMHSKGLVHRDLKLENVFLDENGDVLLGDFGFATSWRPLKKKNKCYGTFQYAAPEVLGHEAYTGPEVDMWSLGAVLYTMLTGSFPFGSKDSMGVYRKIKSGAFAHHSHLSPSAKSLLEKLLQPDPLKRATMMDVLLHPWMQAAPIAPPREATNTSGKRRRWSNPNLHAQPRARLSDAANSLAVIME